MFQHSQARPDGGQHDGQPEEEVSGRSESGFVGLKNQGSTCYLNSLLQVLYMTPELRHGLYAVNPKELGQDHYALMEDMELAEERARVIKEDARRKKDEKEGTMQPDPSIVMKLAQMFSMKWARRAASETKNQGFDLALEWALEHSEDDDDDDSGPGNSNGAAAMSTGPGRPSGELTFGRGEKGERGEKKAKMIPLELQKLFASLQLEDIPSVSTKSFTQHAFGWKSSEGRVQQDAHELVRLLLDELETEMSCCKTNAGLVKALYEGELTTKIECIECGTVSKKSEKYRDVFLQAVGQKDLVSSLHEFTRKEPLTGDSQYFCYNCEQKKDAFRSQYPATVPPVLMFSLNRLDSFSADGDRTKAHEAFKYPLVLDMEPFLNGQAWAESARSHDSSKTGQGGGTLYDLQAVVVHRGSADSGHYHALIRDFLKEGNHTESHGALGQEDHLNPDTDGGVVDAQAGGEHGRWLDFDDRKVSPISIVDLEKPFAGTETAHMLIYRSRSLDEEAPMASMSGIIGSLHMASIPPQYWIDRVGVDIKRCIRAEPLVGDSATVLQGLNNAGPTPVKLMETLSREDGIQHTEGLLEGEGKGDAPVKATKNKKRRNKTRRGGARRQANGEGVGGLVEQAEDPPCGEDNANGEGVGGLVEQAEDPPCGEDNEGLLEGEGKGVAPVKATKNKKRRNKTRRGGARRQANGEGVGGLVEQAEDPPCGEDNANGEGVGGLVEQAEDPPCGEDNANGEGEGGLVEQAEDPPCGEDNERLLEGEGKGDAPVKATKNKKRRNKARRGGARCQSGHADPSVAPAASQPVPISDGMIPAVGDVFPVVTVAPGASAEKAAMRIDRRGRALLWGRERWSRSPFLIKLAFLMGALCGALTVLWPGHDLPPPSGWKRRLQARAAGCIAPSSRGCGGFAVSAAVHASAAVVVSSPSNPSSDGGHQEGVSLVPTEIGHEGVIEKEHRTDENAAARRNVATDDIDRAPSGGAGLGTLETKPLVVVPEVLYSGGFDKGEEGNETPGRVALGDKDGHHIASSPSPSAAVTAAVEIISSTGQASRPNRLHRPDRAPPTVEETDDHGEKRVMTPPQFSRVVRQQYRATSFDAARKTGGVAGSPSRPARRTLDTSKQPTGGQNAKRGGGGSTAGTAMRDSTGGPSPLGGWPLHHQKAIAGRFNQSSGGGSKAVGTPHKGGSGNGNNRSQGQVYYQHRPTHAIRGGPRQQREHGSFLPPLGGRSLPYDRLSLSSSGSSSAAAITRAAAGAVTDSLNPPALASPAASKETVAMDNHNRQRLQQQQQQQDGGAFGEISQGAFHPPSGVSGSYGFLLRDQHHRPGGEEERGKVSGCAPTTISSLTAQHTPGTASSDWMPAPPALGPRQSPILVSTGHRNFRSVDDGAPSGTGSFATGRLLQGPPSSGQWGVVRVPFWRPPCALSASGRVSPPLAPIGSNRLWAKPYGADLDETSRRAPPGLTPPPPNHHASSYLPHASAARTLAPASSGFSTTEEADRSDNLDDFAIASAVASAVVAGVLSAEDMSDGPTPISPLSPFDRMPGRQELAVFAKDSLSVRRVGNGSRLHYCMSAAAAASGPSGGGPSGNTGFRVQEDSSLASSFGSTEKQLLFGTSEDGADGSGMLSFMYEEDEGSSL